MVNTKTAPRRDLAYRSFDEFEADVDRVEAAHRAGGLTTTGNWTPGQIMEHLAKFANCAFDGFDAMAPWPMRKIMILLFKKKMLSGDPMPAGYKLPKKAEFMLPGDEVATEGGLDQIRAVFLRLQGGERFKAKSPLFERLDHDQWCKAQLGHAAMHMSFIDLGESNGGGGNGDG